jgi:hypothetical protein
MKQYAIWVPICGVALFGLGFVVSRHIYRTARQQTRPVSERSGIEYLSEEQLPVITAEFTDQYFSNFDRAKFEYPWYLGGGSPPHVLILRDEKEGWYLGDTLLSDENWNAQISASVRRNGDTLVYLAIHPRDAFGDAVKAASRCKALLTKTTVQGIIMFQCNYK